MEERSIQVKKQTVEQYSIGTLVLNAAEAAAIYNKLGELLGRPKVEHKGCGDRYSHGAHWHGAETGTMYFCSGRSFDAT